MVKVLLISVVSWLAAVAALLFAVFMVFGACFGAGFHWSYARKSA